MDATEGTNSLITRLLAQQQSQGNRTQNTAGVQVAPAVQMPAQQNVPVGQGVYPVAPVVPVQPQAVSNKPAITQQAGTGIQAVLPGQTPPVVPNPAPRNEGQKLVDDMTKYISEFYAFIRLVPVIRQSFADAGYNPPEISMSDLITLYAIYRKDERTNRSVGGSGNKNRNRPKQVQNPDAPATEKQKKVLYGMWKNGQINTSPYDPSLANLTVGQASDLIDQVRKIYPANPGQGGQ